MKPQPETSNQEVLAGLDLETCFHELSPWKQGGSKNVVRRLAGALAVPGTRGLSIMGVGVGISRNGSTL